MHSNFEAQLKEIIERAVAQIAALLTPMTSDQPDLFHSGGVVKQVPKILNNDYVITKEQAERMGIGRLSPSAGVVVVTQVQADKLKDLGLD